MCTRTRHAAVRAGGTENVTADDAVAATKWLGRLLHVGAECRSALYRLPRVKFENSLVPHCENRSKFEGDKVAQLP